ncbi:MAG: peptidoglycan-binding protein [Trueperaceae bacterium]|nr:peptidoglycan-binding protein [Trueperaceae bacterium]
MSKLRFIVIMLCGLWLLVACDSTTVNQTPDTIPLETQACSRATLRQGSTGADVRHAQLQLLKAGNAYTSGTPAYYIRTSGGADGVFGSGTKNAVIAFQKLVFPGQPGQFDGVVGQNTWSKLGCSSTTAPAGFSSSVDNDRDGIWDSYENYLLSTLAPRIWLNSNEVNYPATVSWYLSYSSMRFSHNNCPDHEVLALGRLTGTNLDDQSHSINKSLCRHDYPVYSNSYVGGGESTFFLELQNSARGGSSAKGNWRVYGHVYKTSAGKYVIQWWQFYAFNDSVDPVNHEGDWEYSGLLVNAGSIEKVMFFRHGNLRTISPSEAEWVNGVHHVTYVAKGSHAQYKGASSSGGCITGLTSVGDIAQAVAADRCNKGKVWDTWASGYGGIINVGEKSYSLNSAEWLRYSGLWGEIGALSAGGITFSSGPRTPSYQTSAWKPY